MSRKYKVGIVALLVLAVLAVAWAYLRHQTIAVMEPRGTVALRERNLILFGLLLSLVVVIPVFAMAATIGWRYRENNPKATKYQPEWDHSRLAESIWWGVPALLITILSVVAWNSSHSLDPFRSVAGTAPAVNVEVVAMDWKWLFIYPQQHIASVNLLQFPVDASLNLQITSDAPMNSFWIPQLGGQIYAMPGMNTQLHLVATSKGDYYGASANISGRGFADMHFTARASSASDFYKWVAAARQSPYRLDAVSYQQLAQPSTDNPSVTYALADVTLFSDVLGKYMAPGSMPGMNMNSQMAGGVQ